MSDISVEACILHYETEDRKANPGIIAQLLGVDVKVYTSYEPIGTWRAARHAMLHINQISSHILILENDVIPCQNVMPAVAKIASLLPDDVISLFAGAPVTRKAYTEGRHLFRQDGSTSGQALLIPRSLIGGIIEWGAKNDSKISRPSHAGLDLRVIGYLMESGKTPIHTAPCLVEYVGVKSTMGNRFTGNRWSKTAAVFLGVDFDAMTIDWESAYNKLKSSDARRKFSPRPMRFGISPKKRG
jgi:hypothetical protein